MIQGVSNVGANGECFWFSSVKASGVTWFVVGWSNEINVRARFYGFNL